MKKASLLALLILSTTLPAWAQADQAPAAGQSQASTQDQGSGAAGSASTGSGAGPRGKWRQRLGQGGQQGGDQKRQERRAKMLARFDLNHDGQLDDNEKAQMKQFIQQKRQAKMAKGAGGGGLNGPATQQGIPPQGQ